MNHIMKRVLTLVPVMLLAGSLVGCYTLPKSPGVNYDSEEMPVIIIPEPWPLPPPPPSQPLPPPPSPPTRPIDPKQPVKRTTDGEVKEKEPAGKKSLEMESTRSLEMRRTR